MTDPSSPEEVMIRAAIAYKRRGWRAIIPPQRRPGAGPAILLIGSKDDGWNRLLSLAGDDRFERAQILADRYNAAPLPSLNHHHQEED